MPAFVWRLTYTHTHTHIHDVTGEMGEFAHLCLFPDFVCVVCLSEP